MCSLHPLCFPLVLNGKSHALRRAERQDGYLYISDECDHRPITEVRKCRDDLGRVSGNLCGPEEPTPTVKRANVDRVFETISGDATTVSEGRLAR